MKLKKVLWNMFFFLFPMLILGQFKINKGYICPAVLEQVYRPPQVLEIGKKLTHSFKIQGGVCLRGHEANPGKHQTLYTIVLDVPGNDKKVLKQE